MFAFSDSEHYSLEECKELFIKTLKDTERDGIEKLIEYLDKKSSFFTAPASTRFHESREGGLLRHSLNVYTRMEAEVGHEVQFSPILKERLNTAEDYKKLSSSIAIVALLHDLCKADQYEAGKRNKKTEDGHWVEVPFYKKSDSRLPYGHGEKSVYIASGFIRLTREEAIAIRFHMGDFATDSDTGLAYNSSVLATLLHIADLKATYIDEQGTDFGNN